MDMPSPSTFHHEIPLWKRKWASDESCLSLSEALQQCKQIKYSNIHRILHILLVKPVTSCSVERANSSLRFVKSPFRSTMGEERLNALLLMFIHKDINIDYGKIY